MKIPEHITLDEQAGKADCSICCTGATAPTSGAMRVHLLSAFVVQHATHSKRRTPNGLTSTGRATKAAREALA